ncbi:hypothetical protein P6709_10100 [Jeotgalibacillus sp. ET6]|uniref:lipase family protein n=1 Tax=Jeotgalibacillus sp. ET6 TaxID=3037260 RepID=UPI00241837CE|nr:hypothetical protein [Jeotgalibacillus sp. ET6]MDG5472104.1 hypothetical protein [Jeotgalibacillus sp. ET6]
MDGDLTERMLTDLELGRISMFAYEDNGEVLELAIDGKIVKWDIVNQGELNDSKTGLHGYVLEKDGQMVVAFEGTKVTDNFGIDVVEDLNGIVLGHPDYPLEEYERKYIGTPSQDAAIASGSAKVSGEGTIIYSNDNQFVSAKKELNRVAKENGYKDMDEMVKSVGKENVTFTGHSLGGGLAEFFAVEYDVQGVSFAAANTYNLLSDEKKKRVDDGAYREQIISYAFLTDAVGTSVGGERKNALGSVYYMKEESNYSLNPFNNHGLKNYLNKDQFDENGYYRGEVLIGKGIRTALLFSPLYYKNNGYGNFPIVIKTESMKKLIKEMQLLMMELENVIKVMIQFPDMHDQTISATISSFMGKAGTGAYSELTASDVTNIVNDYARNHASPALFYNDSEHEKALEEAMLALEDTEELISKMYMMAADLNKADQVVARWMN